MKIMCLICNGTGKVKKNFCSHCMGKGHIEVPKLNRDKHRG